MQKETVIARLRLSLHWSEATSMWLRRGFVGNRERYLSDIWAFFESNAEQWDEDLVGVTGTAVRDYFRHEGIDGVDAYVRVVERTRGSWYIDALLTTAKTVGEVFVALKGLSEIPKIADGIEALKDRIAKAIADRANARALPALTQTAATASSAPPVGYGGPVAALEDAEEIELPEPEPPIPPPPADPVRVDFVIDARPLRALSTAKLSQHAIHLSVGVTRHALVLENLGDERMEDIRVGLFQSFTKRNEWKFAEAHAGTVPFLSGKQTVHRSLAEFLDHAQRPFDISHGAEVHIDCWVQDRFGIYLFNFFLPKEQ